jgi:hypothetical protein
VQRLGLRRWLPKGTLSNAVFSSRSFILAPAAALAAGAALGVLTRLLETNASTSGRAAYLVLNEAWPWSALAFCAGLACTSRVASAALAAASLAAAVTAYYAVHAHTTWAVFLSGTFAWGAVALVVGPVLGLAGNLARKRGLHGLPFRLMIPLLAVVETSARLRAEVSVQGPVGETAWTITRLAAVAACLALAAHTVLINRRHRSER